MDGRKKTALVLVFAAVIAGAFLFHGQQYLRSDPSCVSGREERMVRGGSLSGIVEDEEKIEIIFGYYDCNEPEPGDIVAYSYAGREDPLVKIIKAVPGDIFKLEPIEDSWNIMVNGEVLVNSMGEPYTVNPSRHARLRLYEEDYGAGLPADTYMLLSNVAGDSFDSRAFGLVHRSDILGKVELPGR